VQTAHDVKVLKQHYDALSDPDEGEKYFSILPPAQAENVMPMKRFGRERSESPIGFAAFFATSHGWSRFIASIGPPELQPSERLNRK
jgi:hypothetical protein